MSHVPPLRGSMLSQDGVPTASAVGYGVLPLTGLETL